MYDLLTCSIRGWRSGPAVDLQTVQLPPPCRGPLLNRMGFGDYCSTVIVRSLKTNLVIFVETLILAPSLLQ